MSYECAGDVCFDHFQVMPCGLCKIEADQADGGVGEEGTWAYKRRKDDLNAQVRIEAEEIAAREIELVCMDDIEEDNPEWLWEGRIPMGEITLIVGRGSVGKSTILAWLAAKITTGTLNQFNNYGAPKEEPRAVLYVINEDSPSMTVKPRMVAAGADTKMVYEIRLKGKGSIDMMKDGPAIFAAAKRVNAAAIMLDPLSSNVGTAKKNDQDSMRTAFETIRGMADEARVAVIGLGHCKKGGARDLLEALMGSSEQGNVCRAAMGVKEDESRPKTFIWSQEKMNLDEEPAHGFEYQIETKYYPHPKGGGRKDIKTSRIVNLQTSHMNVSDMIKDEASGGKMGEAREWLIEYLTERGGVLKKEVVLEGKKHGHAPRSLEDAARRVCIPNQRVSAGGQAIWELKS
jgi:archaellum biogenesis ATPase FlaH